jgi:hypothetical protein
MLITSTEVCGNTHLIFILYCVRACERHETTYQLPRNVRWRYLKANKPLFCKETSDSQVRIAVHKTYQHTTGKCDSTKRVGLAQNSTQRTFLYSGLELGYHNTTIYFKHIVEYCNRWNIKYIQKFRCETRKKRRLFHYFGNDRQVILKLTLIRFQIDSFCKKVSDTFRDFMSWCAGREWFNLQRVVCLNQ